MPHIDLHNDEPGIIGLFEYRPETARPLSELAEVLLRGPSTLSRGERELIAAYVSSLNSCRFCTAAHAAFAAAQLPGGMAVVHQVCTNTSVVWGERARAEGVAGDGSEDERGGPAVAGLLRPGDVPQQASDARVHGDPVHGDPVHGDPAHGDPAQGDRVQGDRIRGNPADVRLVSTKVAALLRLAARVADSGLAVDRADVRAAAEAGASDAEIHDTVLIAAAFCMFNRYVDGLGATTPDDPNSYALQAQRVVADGYVRSSAT